MSSVVLAPSRASLYVGLAAAVLVVAPLCSTPALAQLKDVAGSKDHPQLKRYEGSTLIGYDFRKFDEFDLLVGPLKRNDIGADSPVTPTKQQRVEGQVTRLLYVVPAGRSPLEVFRNYQQELKTNGFQVLYQCAREECGTDDGWLAEYHLYKMGNRLQQTPPKGGGGVPGQISEYAFNSPKDQRFLTAKRSSPDGDAYISVYVATNGSDLHEETSGHAIALIDVVDTKPMETKMVTVAAAEMAKGIASSGHVALYGLYFDTDKADVKPESAPTLTEIAKLLKQDAKLTLFVVGHTDSVGTYEYNVKLSERRAASVVQALAAQHGVDAKRLKAAGVGMLSPVASNEAEAGRAKNRRVELVKQP